MKIQIDWNDIIGHALKTVITGIVVAAMVIVWKGATTVQDKVDASAKKLIATIDANAQQGEYVKEAVHLISGELADIKNNQAEFDERMQQFETFTQVATKGMDKSGDVMFYELDESANESGVEPPISEPVTSPPPAIVTSENPKYARPDEDIPRNYLQQKLPELPEWGRTFDK